MPRQEQEREQPGQRLEREQEQRLEQEQRQEPEREQPGQRLARQQELARPGLQAPVRAR